MDFADYSRILSSRIKSLEPENVTKIIGYLLLQNGEQAIINLASSPDFAIQEAVFKAKTKLNLLNIQSVPSPVSPLQYAPFSPGSTRSPLTRSSFPAPYHNSEFMPMNYSDAISELQSQTQLLSLEDQIEPVNPGFSSDYHFPDVGLKNLPPRMMARRFSGLNEFPNKTCHYFNKGFCKHGSHCRYSHAQIPENFARAFDAVNDDHLFSPGSLEKLELEIVELLKSRKGNPVSIASLPNLYYEKYGKVLQAEGYLTESQRHGKAGYSLTKLLARLRNSIRLIDRPHGQHSVILAEDYAKYSENFGDRSPGPIVSGSRQIYLTFPAESTFTEDDVSHYFNTYGPVEDVRIPCQQNRMFGFVTFESAETVKMVLAKGNPHFVCGARVLVKPYREKSKSIDRKYQERMARMYFPSPYVDIDADLHSFPREHENSMLLRKRLIEEQEQALEFQRQLARLQAAQKSVANQSYFSYSMDRLKLSQDGFDFPSPDPYSFLFDGLNTDPVSDGKLRLTEANYTDQDSQTVNLPDSPFASLSS